MVFQGARDRGILRQVETCDKFAVEVRSLFRRASRNRLTPDIRDAAFVLSPTGICPAWFFQDLARRGSKGFHHTLRNRPGNKH